MSHTPPRKNLFGTIFQYPHLVGDVGQFVSGTSHTQSPHANTDRSPHERSANRSVGTSTPRSEASSDSSSVTSSAVTAVASHNLSSNVASRKKVKRNKLPPSRYRMPNQSSSNVKPSKKGSNGATNSGSNNSDKASKQTRQPFFDITKSILNVENPIVAYGRSLPLSLSPRGNSQSHQPPAPAPVVEAVAEAENTPNGNYRHVYDVVDENASSGGIGSITTSSNSNSNNGENIHRRDLTVGRNRDDYRDHDLDCSQQNSQLQDPEFHSDDGGEEEEDDIVYIEEQPPEDAVPSCSGALSLTPKQLAEVFVVFENTRRMWYGGADADTDTGAKGNNEANDDGHNGGNDAAGVASQNTVGEDRGRTARKTVIASDTVSDNQDNHTRSSKNDYDSNADDASAQVSVGALSPNQESRNVTNFNTIASGSNSNNVGAEQNSKARSFATKVGIGSSTTPLPTSVKNGMRYHHSQPITTTPETVASSNSDNTADTNRTPSTPNQEDYAKPVPPTPITSPLSPPVLPSATSGPVFLAYSPDVDDSDDSVGDYEWKKRAESLEMECATLKEIIKIDSSNLFKLKRAVEAQRCESQQKRAKFNLFQIEVKKMQTRLETIQKERSAFRQREADYQETIDVLKTEIDKLCKARERTKTLPRHPRSKNEIVSDIKLLAQTKQLMGENRMHVSRIAEYELRVAELNQSIQLHREENDALHERIAELEMEHHMSLKPELNDVDGILQHYNRDTNAYGDGDDDVDAESRFMDSDDDDDDDDRSYDDTSYDDTNEGRSFHHDADYISEGGSGCGHSGDIDGNDSHYNDDGSLSESSSLYGTNAASSTSASTCEREDEHDHAHDASQGRGLASQSDPNREPFPTHRTNGLARSHTPTQASAPHSIGELGEILTIIANRLAVVEKGQADTRDRLDRQLANSDGGLVNRDDEEEGPEAAATATPIPQAVRKDQSALQDCSIDSTNDEIEVLLATKRRSGGREDRQRAKATGESSYCCDAESCEPWKTIADRLREADV